MKPKKRREQMSTYLKLMIIIIAGFSLINCQKDISSNDVKNKRNIGLQKLEYNNPDLLVDLDVGFKSVPMPMDFDGDGDNDLLISESGAYAEAGVFYFENISGNIDAPIFRQGAKISSERFRLGDDGKYFVVSEVAGRTHVLTPDRSNNKLLMYEDVPQNVFWKKTDLNFPVKEFIPETKHSTWKIIDFNGDSVFDMMGSIATKQGNHILFFKNEGTNEIPKYKKPDKIITESNKPIGSNLYLETPWADFDNDGDFDFMGIGVFGEIIYFENKGDSKNYKFNLGNQLTFNGQSIQMISRHGGAMKPRAIDFNKDGWTDLIMGEEGGKVSFLKNTGKVIDGIPQFLPPKFFQQEAKYVDFGALVAPRVFDWNGDGLEDIIAGNGLGHIGFIKNLGGTNPKWDIPVLLEVDGDPVRVIADKTIPNTELPLWGYATIDVGYWDEDKLPDILVNDHNGNIAFIKNIGTSKKPKLMPPQPLEVKWKGKPQKPAWIPGVSEGNELLAPWRTSPLIMDYNTDGLNDLVMLDYEGYLVVYPRFKVNGKLILGHPERNFVFPTGEPILLNQRTGSSSGRLKITFADWDGDGLKDLVFSSKPAVDWMKNMGKKDGKMVLQYMGRIISKTLMGHTDGPVVSDWNKDGIPDLLVGTETGIFYYWERPDINITTTMTTTGKQKPANYPYFKR